MPSIKLIGAKAEDTLTPRPDAVPRAFALVPGAQWLTPHVKFQAPCPVGANHKKGDEHPSFAMWLDPDARLAWNCSVCGDRKALRTALEKLGVPRADLGNGAAGAARGTANDLYARKPKAPPKQPDPLSDQERPHDHHSALMSPTHVMERKRLMTRRGWTEATLQRRKIGWDGERYTFPVRLSGGGLWLNERRYALGGKPKMLNTPGHGTVTLYGAEFLESNTLPVLMTEGEPDQVYAQQLADEEPERRFVAVSHTGGAKTIPKDLSPLAGRQVFVCFDTDEPGRDGAEKMRAALVAAGARAFVVDLTELGMPSDDTTDNDLSDWFGKHSGTVDRLMDEIERLGSGADPDDEFEQEVARQIESLRIREEAARRYAEQKAAERAATYGRVRKQDGAAFALDLPDGTPCLWGSGRTVLMAAGEALMLAGGDGSGKTTLAQQLMLAMMGLGPGAGSFLGYPVTPLADGRRVLYLAMDRPQQIARSLGRFVSEDDRAVLEERLWVWNGPLPIDPLAAPENLANWIADEFGTDVGLVVVDSYKDLVPGIAEDKPGAQFNSAMQEVIARGIDWIGLHHQRKPSAERKADADITLHDIYGSRWLTAGAGSVLAIQGDAGARTVELVHVKQPDTPAPRLVVNHDGDAGGAEAAHPATSPVDVLASTPGVELTLREIAAEVYPTEAPSRALDKRVDRALTAAKNGSALPLERLKGTTGGVPRPPRWVYGTAQS